MNTGGTQSGKFMTSKKVNIELCLPEFSATKIVTCKCHLHESNNGSYKLIIARNLLTYLGLDHKFYGCVIVGGKGPYEGCLDPMFDVINYNYAPLTDKTVKLE